LEGNRAVLASGVEGVQEVVTSGAPYLNERKKVLRVAGE
jgi:hypothetical protein